MNLKNLTRQIQKSIIFGLAAMALLIVFYFLILNLVSGWNFTESQFVKNWYWIIGLSAGFGGQIGIFTYLKTLPRTQVSGKATTASGATSAVAMISCCSHYLVNILPLVGISGIIAIIGQYQTELFFIGLGTNLLGLTYLVRKLIKLKGM